MNKVMKAVLIEPGKEARVAMIDGSLHGMQEIVDGLIAPVYFDDAVLLCNDEGKIRQLPFNRALLDENGNVTDFIAGTCFICGLGTEDFTGLDDEAAEKYRKKFLLPEELLCVDGRYIVHRYRP